VKVRILEPALGDLIDEFHFYEDQEVGAGRYFLDNLYSDIERLETVFGIHRQPFDDFYRVFFKRFPFPIFYSIRETEIWVEAVIDCRRKPSWIRSKSGNLSEDPTHHLLISCRAWRFVIFGDCPDDSSRDGYSTFPKLWRAPV